MVQKHSTDNADVRGDIRPSNDVHYRVYGLRLLLDHGDMLGVKGGDGIIGAIGRSCQSASKFDPPSASNFDPREPTGR